MDSKKYSPKDGHNFLRDWLNGWANKPVTWVSIEDSREYCEWNGKRLPHEWERQYSAQGSDGRLHPWGNTFDTFFISKILKNY
jgi:formylglycine-generating enzyme required for sulfatase activity